MKITIRKLDNKLVTWNGGNDSSDPLLEEIDVEQDNLPEGDFNRMFYENGILLIKEFSLDEVKQQRNDYISECFEKEFQTGTFQSVTLGIEVDCRRYGYAIDDDNVSKLISNYSKLETKYKYYKGKSETTSFPCTLEQLQTLKAEMDGIILMRYAKKRILRDAISKCTTKEQVERIVW